MFKYECDSRKVEKGQIFVALKATGVSLRIVPFQSQSMFLYFIHLTLYTYFNISIGVSAIKVASAFFSSL